MLQPHRRTGDFLCSMHHMGEGEKQRRLILSLFSFTEDLPPATPCMLSPMARRSHMTSAACKEGVMSGSHFDLPCAPLGILFRGKCTMNFHATHKTLSHRSRFGFLDSVLQTYSCLVMSFFFLTGSQLSNTFSPLFLPRGSRTQ